MENEYSRPHGCVTAWLGLTLIGYVAITLSTQGSIEAANAAHRVVSGWVFWPRTAALTGFLISAWGVYVLKFWAVWVALASTVTLVVLNLCTQHGIVQSAPAFVTPLFTFLLIRFCGKPKGLSQVK